MEYLFPRIDHMGDNRTNRNKFRRTEAVPNMSFNYNGIKLKVNNKTFIKHS